MAEPLKVFLAEDSESERERILEVLSNMPTPQPRVILTATSLVGARANVEQLGELGVKLAILDGSLSLSLSMGDRDGEIIAQAIRDAHPNIKLIGYSGVALKYVDANIEKNPAQIPVAIAQLGLV